MSFVVSGPGSVNLLQISYGLGEGTHTRKPLRPLRMSSDFFVAPTSIPDLLWHGALCLELLPDCFFPIPVALLPLGGVLCY